MNTPIRRLGIFAMLLFGALLVNVTWIQGFNAESIKADPLNRRQFAEQQQQHRGPVLVGDEQIAYSEPVEDDDGPNTTFQRRYENGELYSHTLGWYLPYSAGGVEETENSLLNGTDDRLAVRNFMDTLTGKEQKGASVQLTLDPAAQQAAYEGMSQGGHDGAAVALDPETGAVLASVALPGYDPSKVAEDVEYFNQLEQEEKQPLVDRALQYRYAPGSTFKVVTAAAALENGAEPDSTMDAPASVDLGSPLPNAWGGPCNGGEPDPLGHSIERSCNTSMANWALDLGTEKMAEQAEKFGFNQGGMEIPLDVAESLYPREDDRNLVGRSGIGQANVEATPLQMAMVAAGVANRGDVMKPYLVDSVKDSDATDVVANTPEKLSTAVSADTADDLKDMMIRVTEGAEASGPGGAIPGIKVAGKTGTAETGSGPTHNWFISFAPADDPQVAVAVVVEHGGGSGGTVAAPIAKGIMEAVINE